MVFQKRKYIVLLEFWALNNQSCSQFSHIDRIWNQRIFDLLRPSGNFRNDPYWAIDNVLKSLLGTLLTLHRNDSNMLSFISTRESNSKIINWIDFNSYCFMNIQFTQKIVVWGKSYNILIEHYDIESLITLTGYCYMTGFL